MAVSKYATLNGKYLKDAEQLLEANDTVQACRFSSAVRHIGP